MNLKQKVKQLKIEKSMKKVILRATDSIGREEVLSLRLSSVNFDRLLRQVKEEEDLRAELNEQLDIWRGREYNATFYPQICFSHNQLKKINSWFGMLHNKFYHYELELKS